MPVRDLDAPEVTPRAVVDGDEPEWRPHAQPSVRVLRPDEPGAAATRAPAEPPPAPEEPAVEEVVPSRLPRVLGINLVGGAAYLAVIERPNRPLLDLADVIFPVGSLDLGARLEEFSRQVSQLLRNLRVSSVAVARPLRYSNWRYADALERASLETCIALEAYRLSVPHESVGQHHAANVIGLPLERLDDALPAKLRIEKTARWVDRYPAVLVALAVALAGPGHVDGSSD